MAYKTLNGFTRVAATADELAEYREKNGGRYPSVRRVACKGCGKRLWGSGMGIGSHRRACSLFRYEDDGS